VAGECLFSQPKAPEPEDRKDQMLKQMRAESTNHQAVLSSGSNGATLLTPGEMADENLASFVQDSLVRFSKVIPYVIELRNRFGALPRGKANISGCVTWTEFCQKVLHRTDRAVRKAIAAAVAPDIEPEADDIEYDGELVIAKTNTKVNLDYATLVQRLNPKTQLLGVAECRWCKSLCDKHYREALVIIEPAKTIEENDFYWFKAMLVDANPTPNAGGSAVGNIKAFSKPGLEVFDAISLGNDLAARMVWGIHDFDAEPKDFNDFLFTSKKQFVDQHVLNTPPVFR
jgi:hypothetical protein